MENILNRILKQLDLKRALIIAAIFGLLLWLIDFSPIGVAGLLQLTGGVGILDFETRYTADFAYQWFSAMGEAGRQFHLTRIMPLDLLFPPAFAAFQFCLLGLLFRATTKEENPLRLTLLLPFLYLLLDYSENVGITAMLINYPTRLNLVAVTTGIITSVKKTVILSIIVVFAALLIVFAVKKLKGAFHAETEGEYKRDHTGKVA